MPVVGGLRHHPSSSKYALKQTAMLPPTAEGERKVDQ